MSKTHKCSRCGSNFSTKRDLDRHVKAKHKQYYYSIRFAPIIVIVILLVVAAIYLVSLNTPQPTTSTTTSSTTVTEGVLDLPLPRVTENGLSSEKVTLRHFLTQGKPVLLEFMVSWCDHCKKMVPVIEDLYTTFGGTVNFVSVAGRWNGANANTTAQFLKQYHSSLPYVLDEDNDPVFGFFNISQTPTFLIFDSNGKLLTKLEGEQTSATLISWLQRIS